MISGTHVTIKIKFSVTFLWILRFIRSIHIFSCLLDFFACLLRKLAQWAGQNQALSILLPPQSIHQSCSSPRLPFVSKWYHQTHACLYQKSRSYFRFFWPLPSYLFLNKACLFYFQSISWINLILPTCATYHHPITTISCLHYWDNLLTGITSSTLDPLLSIVTFLKTINSTISLLCLKSSSSFSLLVE